MDDFWHSTWKWDGWKTIFFPFESFFLYSSLLGSVFLPAGKWLEILSFWNFLPKEHDPSDQVDCTIFFQMGSKHQNHSFPKYRWILQPPNMWLEVEVWQMPSIWGCNICSIVSLDMKDLLYDMIHTQDAAIPALLRTETLDFSSLFKQKEKSQWTCKSPSTCLCDILVKQKKKQAESIPDFNYVYIIIHLAIWGGNQKSIEIPMVIFFPGGFFPWMISHAFVVGLTHWRLHRQGQRCRAWSVGLGVWVEIQTASGSLGDMKTSKKMGYIHKSIWHIWWHMMTLGCEHRDSWKIFGRESL